MNLRHLVSRNSAGNSPDWRATALTLLLAATLLCFHLTDFPAYFFCDEAAQGVEAEHLLKTGADSAGTRWPLYPISMGEYQFSGSIYAQIPFNFLFGLNEFSVRLRTVVFSMLGMFGVSLFCATHFRWRYLWVVPCLFMSSPLWFLHSRTGFEAIQAVSLLALFLLSYSRMLSHERPRTRDILLAAIGAAGAFYSYLPARGWTLLLLGFCFLTNLPQHWRRRGMTAVFFALLLLLLVPAIRKTISEPQQMLARARLVGLDEFLGLSTHEKVTRFSSNYFSALDPRFWFTESGVNRDGPEERHTIPNRALIPLWAFPFAAFGFGYCLWRWRNPGARIVLGVLLIGPITAAPFGISSLRVFPVGFAYLVLASCGLMVVLEVLLARFSRARIFCFVSACAAPIALTRYAVFETGPMYRDYGFYGLQWGARQVFTWVREQQANYNQIVFAGSFNGTAMLYRFYIGSGSINKFRDISPETVCREPRRVASNDLVVLRPGDLEIIQNQGCPLHFKRLDSIRGPLNQELFVFGTFEYPPEFEAWFAADQQEQRRPISSEVKNEGALLRVAHTRIDIGTINDIFDGNTRTLGRSALVNPFILDIELEPRQINALQIVFSHNPALSARIEVFSASKRVGEYTNEATLVGETGTLTLQLPELRESVTRVKIEALGPRNNADEPIHIREIRLLPSP